MGPWTVSLLLVAVNIAVRLPFWGINGGEYTDGILQLNVFTIKAGLYPPLYGSLAWLAALTGLELQTAGQLVSLAAASLGVIPIYLMTARHYSPGAARFAALFYTLSPLVMRWSLRVMTDALFLSLVAGVFALIAAGLDRRREDGRRWAADAPLAAANLLAVAAALTRYQGALLGVIVLLAGAIAWRRTRRLPLFTCLSFAVWALLPWWAIEYGFAHGGQFSERRAGDIGMTLLAYWNLLESFVLIAPFYFAYPVAAFFLIGALRATGGAVHGRTTLALFTLFAAGILVAQAAFGSFQYRYMMPLLPGILAVAGAGAAWAEERAYYLGRSWMFRAALIVSVIWCTGQSIAVVLLQSGAFADQREAADYVRDKVPPGTRVLANERYGNFHELGCVKLAFWSGKPVEPITEPAGNGALRLRELREGDILILGNQYGGNDAVAALSAEIASRHRLVPLVRYQAQVVPLFDDIMVQGAFNQNPLGWVLRYTPQEFETRVLRVGTSP